MHTTSKKLIIGAVGAVLLLPACASEKPTASDASGAPDFAAHGPITIAMGKDLSGRRTQEVAEWNKAHADQKVTIVELPEAADAQRAQLVQQAQIKSGDFTIVRLDAVWTAEFAANGWVSVLPDGLIDTSGYLPQTLETARYFGKTYAIPDATGAGLLYYRKDLLDAAGLKPPTTWAELKAACTKIKSRPGNSKINCYAGQFQKYEGLTVNLSEAIDSAGGQVVSDDGKVEVDSAQAKAGLEFLTSSFADGTIPKSAITWQEEQGRTAFQSGELIFLRNWAYVYALAQKTDGSSEVAGKIGVSPLPGLNGLGVSTLGGNNLAISSYGPNKGTAVDFIRWLNRPEAQKARMLKTTEPPPLRSVYTDPDVVKANPYMPALLAGIERAEPRPVVVHYDDLTRAMQDAAYDALRGVQTPEQALGGLQGKLEPIVKQ